MKKWSQQVLERRVMWLLCWWGGSMGRISPASWLWDPKSVNVAEVRLHHITTYIPGPIILRILLIFTGLGGSKYLQDMLPQAKIMHNSFIDDIYIYYYIIYYIFWKLYYIFIILYCIILLYIILHYIISYYIIYSILFYSIIYYILYILYYILYVIYLLYYNIYMCVFQASTSSTP